MPLQNVSEDRFFSRRRLQQTPWSSVALPARWYLLKRSVEIVIVALSCTCRVSRPDTSYPGHSTSIQPNLSMIWYGIEWCDMREHDVIWHSIMLCHAGSRATCLRTFASLSRENGPNYALDKKKQWHIMGFLKWRKDQQKSTPALCITLTWQFWRNGPAITKMRLTSGVQLPGHL